MRNREQLIKEFLESVDSPVIVEGRKDRVALESFGVKNVVQLNRGGSLLELVESLQDCDSIVLLTDLDQQGKILRKKLLKLMGPYGIHENKKPREILARMRLSHVEGLKSLR